MNEAAKNLPIPETWLNQSVMLVFISGASTEYTNGMLEEVNDRGIVLLVETHIGQQAQPLFYPWSAVIQLSVSRDR